MTDTIFVVVETAIADGKAEEMKKICDTAVEIAQSKEIGTLSFNQYFKSDNTASVSLELYENSDALMTHMDNAARDIHHVGEIATVTRIDIFGEVDDRVKAFFQPYKANFHTRYSGFTR
ncbi:MAG: hypothetical protein GY798_27095 [Hyphomicrobiales bacterium]|nr:hypothetical protein [Hyphomicrobiales bacterium]